MVKGPVTGPGPIPANMPSMEERDPYREQLGSSSCQGVYGSAGGADSGTRMLRGNILRGSLVMVCWLLFHDVGLLRVYGVT